MGSAGACVGSAHSPTSPHTLLPPKMRTLRASPRRPDASQRAQSLRLESGAVAFRTMTDPPRRRQSGLLGLDCLRQDRQRGPRHRR